METEADLDAAAGAALRQARFAQGLTHEALAGQADIDQSVLSKIERLGPGAGWAKFCRVAKALGYRVEVKLIHTRSD